MFLGTIGYLQNIGADDKNAPTEERSGINKDKARKRVHMEGEMELEKIKNKKSMRSSRSFIHVMRHGTPRLWMFWSKMCRFSWTV